MVSQTTEEELEHSAEPSMDESSAPESRSKFGIPTLEEAMREGLSPKEARRLSLRAAEALAARHARDEPCGPITPRSFALGRGGEVSVDDGPDKGPALYRLRYASPETARREPPSKESDVFELALVVRELIEGLPARRSSGDDLAMEAVDGRVSAPHGLSGELASLAVRAASPLPEQRPAASEFAAALQGTPRFRGFSGAEWVIAGIAGVAAIMLAFMLREAASEKERATRQSLEARAAFEGFLSGLYPELDDLRDIAPFARAGERALASMEAMNDDERSPEDRELFAKTLLWNGEAQRVQGRTSEAEALFERALTRAADLPDGSERSEIELLAHVALGGLAKARMEDFAALEHLERAMAIGEAAMKEDPSDRDVTIAMARAHVDHGALLASSDRAKASVTEASLERAEELLVSDVLDGAGSERAVVELKSELNLVSARFYESRGEIERALKSMARHVGQSNWLADVEPARSARRATFARGAMALGELLQAEGRYAEATRYQTAAVQAWKLLRQSEPDEPLWERAWADASWALARAFRGVGNWKDAQRRHELSLKVMRRLAEEEPDDLSYVGAIVEQCLDAADGLIAAGHLKDAESYVVEARSVGRRLPGVSGTIAGARIQLVNSELRLAQGQKDKAYSAARTFRAMAHDLAEAGEDVSLQLERARAALVMSAVDMMDGNTESARSTRMNALDIVNGVLEDRPLDPVALSVKARALYFLGEDEAAAEVLEQLDELGYKGLELHVVRAAALLER